MKSPASSTKIPNGRGFSSSGGGQTIAHGSFPYLTILPSTAHAEPSRRSHAPFRKTLVWQGRFHAENRRNDWRLRSKRKIVMCFHGDLAGMLPKRRESVEANRHFVALPDDSMAGLRVRPSGLIGRTRGAFPQQRLHICAA